MNDQVTNQQMLAWKNLRETKAFIDALKETEMLIMESWANERFVGETSEVTLQKNASALGRIQAIQDIIDNVENVEPDDDD